MNNIKIELEKLEDGSCSTTFCENGEAVLTRLKAMQASGEEFDIDSLGSTEKAFLAMMNALYGLSMIGQFEE